jgi:hydroxyacylglutathione hydrolase
MSFLNVSAIPAFTDNYIWLMRTGGNTCAVVDPGEAQPVLDVLEREGLELRYILLTHHHWDHVGGMPELKKKTGAVVLGPKDSRIEGTDYELEQGDIAKLPAMDLEFTVLEVPGHTTSHIVFTGHGVLYCGDTLFSAGCGRLFEGTVEQMQSSLDKLAALPADTLVYCGHEYTLSNCEFALAVEPDNLKLQNMHERVAGLRAEGKCTLPGRLSEELAVNPFMRSRQQSVVSAARKRDASAAPGAKTLGIIRHWKDNW